MKRFIPLLAIIATLAAILMPTAFANAADEPTATNFASLDCSDFGNTKNKPEPTNYTTDPTQQVRASVDNIFLRLLTYGTLRQRLRCDPLIVGRQDADGNAITVSVYRVSQNLVNFGILIILVVVAFANILRIKLDTYAIKKTVPLLIFGVIMANLALPIIRTIVDISGVLTATVIGEIGDLGTRASFTDTLIRTVYSGGAELIGQTLSSLDGGGSAGWGDALALVGIPVFAVAALGPFLVVLIVGFLALIFVPAIIFFSLGVLFVARIYILVILAAVSPIAFASLGFEPLKGKLWGWWWKQFINWTFMAPATFALMWLAVQFYRAVGGEMDIGTYIVTIVLLGLAIQIPIKMGGTMMGEWSKKFAAPLKGALLSPFTAGQKYVQSATPRDVSRSLSARGLNFGRQGKEIAKVWEEKAASAEAVSTSVKRGQFQGRLTASMGLGKAIFNPEARSSFGQQVYQTTEGRQRAADAAKDFFKESGIDPTLRWKDVEGNAGLRKKYDDHMDTLQGSKDKDKIAATILVNGMLGRELDPTKQGEMLGKLSQGNVDTTPLIQMYERLMAEKGILVGTKLDAKGKTGEEAHKEITIATLDKIDKTLSRMTNEQQEQTLLQILDQLKQSCKELGNLEEIQKNPNYEAWAAAIFKHSQQNPALTRLKGKVEETPELVRHREALGFAPAGKVFDVANGGYETYLSEGHQRLLQRVVEQDGLSANDIEKRLPQEEFNNLANLRRNTILFEQLKRDLYNFLDSQLSNPQFYGINVDPSTVARIKEQIIKHKLNPTDHFQLPEKITVSDLTAEGIDSKDAERIVAIIRPYNAAAQTFRSLEEAHPGIIEKNAKEDIEGDEEIKPQNATA